jgi:large subunit ribosomal protein L3
MIYTLLGTKKNMTSTYDTRGRRVGATVIEVTPSFVTQIKSSETKDGYEAIQLGHGAKKSTRKPQLGHAKKAGIEMGFAHFKEVRIKPMRTSSRHNLAEQVQNSIDGVQLGQELKLGQVFFVGDAVKVTGTSKGKGFQGGVRRHGFHGGPKTHGQSDRHRAPGSIGSGTTPGRVLKGKKMAGHMGVDQVSVTGLEVVAVDRANNLVTIKGAVPGPLGGLVIIEKQGRIKGYTPPPEEKEEEGDEEVKEQKSFDAQDHGAETKGEGEEVQAGERIEEVKTEEKTEEVRESKEVVVEEEKGEKENAG